MKRASFTSLLMLLSAVFCPAQAAPLSFTPGGESDNGLIRCELPLNAIGALPLKNGSTSINGKVITVRAASELTDTPAVILAGSVLRTEASTATVPGYLTVLACFLMGDYLSLIDDAGTPDAVFRKEGQIQGRILGLENDCLVVAVPGRQKEKISLSSILYIRSPRVFVVKLKLKNNRAIEKDTAFQTDAEPFFFRPTATPRSVSLSSVIPPKKNADGTDAAPAGTKSLSPLDLFNQNDGEPAAATTPTTKSRIQLPSWME